METINYAMLGATTWRCHIWRDNGDDSYAECGPHAEYPNRGLAKVWMNRTLPTQPGRIWWGRIERGTYADNSFDDPGFGYVQDADWEPDGTEDIAFLAADGVNVDWELEG